MIDRTILQYCVLIPALFVGLVACDRAPRGPDPTTGTAESAIVNGTRDPQVIDLTNGELLALGWLHPAGHVHGAQCTGTIIAPRAVATAQHCVWGARPRDLGFGIGQDIYNPVHVFSLADIVSHSNADVAILLLDEDATDYGVEPIPANTVGITNDDVGTPVQAGGYGETYDASRDGRWFATVYLRTVIPDMIEVDGRGDQGICYGDSGGPVMWEGADGPVVLGVESNGDSSCVDLDWLTRLDPLADWISSALSGEGPVGESCEGLDYLGRCVDGVAEWCDGDAIQREDCAASGLYCGWTGEQYGYYCTSRTPTCRERDEVGYCEDGTATFCVDGQTIWDDCTASGLACVVDPADGHARCGSSSGEDTGVADVGPSEDTGSGGSDVGGTDAGVTDTGSGGGLDADLDGAAQADLGDGNEGGKSSDDSSGCGCVSGTEPATPSTLPALLLLAGLALVARRRPRPARDA